MNSVLQVAKKVTNPLGFQKGYNVVLFFIFGGALLGFVLARFEYLSINGVFCKPGSTKGATPGECYWYDQHLYKVGISLHLGCMLPAGFLAVFQFIPKIRHRAMIYHRVSGTFIVLLVLLSNAGAIIIARHAFGGSVATQTLVGTLFCLSTFGILNAYYNIKRLQIDQHRAWMLRTWAWMAAIITARLALLAMMASISVLPKGYEFYDQRGCVELESIAGPEALYKYYPQCQPQYANWTTDSRVVIKADFYSDNPFEKVAVAGISFAPTTWLCLFLHILGMELYLAFTPKEAQRLRQVSYERQLERGFKNPGFAGLVIEKFADCDPWTPETKEPQHPGDGRDVSASSSDDDSINLEKRLSRPPPAVTA